MHRTLTITSSTRILGVILQSMSINLEMFISARFFIGFGVAIAQGSSPLLITEVVHPQHRAIFTTMYNSVYTCLQRCACETDVLKRPGIAVASSLPGSHLGLIILTMIGPGEFHPSARLYHP